MRIQRHLYDALKRIHSSQGSSRECSVDEIDELLDNKLITEDVPNPQTYRLELTARGLACIEDRPIEDKNVRIQFKAGKAGPGFP